MFVVHYTQPVVSMLVSFNSIIARDPGSREFFSWQQRPVYCHYQCVSIKAWVSRVSRMRRKRTSRVCTLLPYADSTVSED